MVWGAAQLTALLGCRHLPELLKMRPSLSCECTKQAERRAAAEAGTAASSPRSWLSPLAGLGMAGLTVSLGDPGREGGSWKALAPSRPELERAFCERVRACFADKLMEETEELCLQREQREVGAPRCSALLLVPSTSRSGRPLAATACGLYFWHSGIM